MSLTHNLSLSLSLTHTHTRTHSHTHILSLTHSLTDTHTHTHTHTADETKLLRAHIGLITVQARRVQGLLEIKDTHRP